MKFIKNISKFLARYFNYYFDMLSGLGFFLFAYQLFSFIDAHFFNYQYFPFYFIGVCLCFFLCYMAACSFESFSISRKQKAKEDKIDG